MNDKTHTVVLNEVDDEVRDDSCAFSFGSPESALAPNPSRDFRGLTLMTEGEYYNPPLSFKGLGMLLRTNPQHSPLPHYRARNVCKYMKPNALIKRQTLYSAVFEHQGIGNGFLKWVRNKQQGIIGVGHSPALNTRRMKADDQYGWIGKDHLFTPYKKGEILHIKQYDPMQNIYGVPYWIGALQSILLGEEIRMFPRRFFNNGATTGNLIFTAGLGKKDRDVINEQFASVKGKKNFSSLAFHLPKGDVDKIIKVVSMAEHAAKIDFTRLGEMTGKDILKAWGIRPELVGQTAETAGTGSGDLNKLIRMDHELNTVPLQQDFEDAMNEFLPLRHQLEFYTFDELNPENNTDKPAG